MSKGGIGPSLGSKMFITSTAQGSHTLPISGTNFLRDMALALVLELANINLTPLSLMI
jgi:hypothetical protein